MTQTTAAAEGAGAAADTTNTKVFVGGLAWETQKETMRSYFEKFGDIVEAVVISDKATGRSKGYGFVTFRDAEAATRACVDGSPVIDGRRANCNLASLGVQRSKPSTPKLAAAAAPIASVAGAGRGMRAGMTNFQMGYGGAGLGTVFPAVAAASVGATTFPHYSIQQGIPFANLYGYSTYNVPDYSYATNYYSMHGGATQFPVFGSAVSGSTLNSAAAAFYPYTFGKGTGTTAAAATYPAEAGQSYGFQYQPHHLLHYGSSAFPQHYGPRMSPYPSTPFQSVCFAVPQA